MVETFADVLAAAQQRQAEIKTRLLAGTIHAPALTTTVTSTPPASPAVIIPDGAGDVGVAEPIIERVDRPREGEISPVLAAVDVVTDTIPGAPPLVPGMEITPVAGEDVLLALGVAPEEKPFDKFLKVLGLDPDRAKKAIRQGLFITAGFALLPVAIPFAGRLIGSVVEAFQLARPQRR